LYRDLLAGVGILKGEEAGMQGAVAATAVSQFADRVIANIETVIIGKRQRIEYLLVALLARGHVLVEDVPGTGKTMLARAAAASMTLTFTRVQCTPDLLPNDIVGVGVYNQHRGDFEFRPGPVFTNILLADEINRATPRTQAALLEAMQERQVSAEGQTRPLPDPFLVIATQNPIEFEGTFPLPEAQLDRFLIRMPVGYTTEAEEIQLLRNLRKAHPIDAVHPIVDAAELPPLYDVVTDIHVDETLERYIVEIVRATRDSPEIAVGASPRGSLALYKTSQALAAIRGRDYVIPEDIKEMAPLALPHRLIVKPESMLRGRAPETILADILQAVPLDLGDSE
jgi:MoxR-like ATPase